MIPILALSESKERDVADTSASNGGNSKNSTLRKIYSDEIIDLWVAAGATLKRVAKKFGEKLIFLLGPLNADYGIKE